MTSRKELRLMVLGTFAHRHLQLLRWHCWGKFQVCVEMESLESLTPRIRPTEQSNWREKKGKSNQLPPTVAVSAELGGKLSSMTDFD